MVALTALASAACYALALVLAQIGLRGQSVLAGATVSLPTTALVLCLIGLVRLDPAGFEPRAAAIFAGTGLFFPVAVTLLSFQGNRLLGPNLAGALGNATPVFAVAFGILILSDHLTAQGAVGLASILGGVALLSIRGRLETRTWSAVSLAIPLAAAVIRGTAQPVVKLGLAFWPDPLAATVISYAASAFVMLAVSFWLGRGRPLLPDLKAAPLFGCVGLLNGASVLLLYSALSIGRVSVVAPLVAIYPLFTLAFSTVLLRGERLHARLVAGIAATVLGVVLLLAKG
ncbi:DMT family transporter [Enterovirga aerilata]|uniref:DMT family transporter n=1 Tax=Enterovirga aerilata TaxID=2730920 RepID=A0A849I7Z2_9HYPH|nr:EamA family transporter [Enterovirga sp. DB1703]NNM72180.1 DMT family transporter [Enterovirga sp. DB1703]